MRRTPDFIFYLLVLMCLFCLGSPVPAQNLSQATGALPPQEAARQLNRQGIEFQSAGKLKEAVDCYRQAIKINPQGAGYHNNLALALKDLGEWNEAESEARLALRLRPGRADYHFNLGIILQRLKRLTEAEAAFNEALKLDSGDTDCHYRLAQIYF
ncbi:MAG TPA: tetratricopeptide repeat protein, partial [Candidatus Obscuribacter sp.]|nr:tetratricopeptide repeat protein [Candidatus Obscuribacter sp.]